MNRCTHDFADPVPIYNAEPIQAVVSVRRLFQTLERHRWNDAFAVGLALLSAFIRRYIEDWYQCHVNYCRVTFLVEATRPANLIVADQVPVHLSSRICCRWTFPRSISNGSRPLKHKPRSRAYPITLIFAKLSGLVSRSRRPRFRPLVQAQSMPSRVRSVRYSNPDIVEREPGERPARPTGSFDLSPA